MRRVVLGLLGMEGSVSPSARAGATIVGMALRCLITGVRYKAE